MDWLALRREVTARAEALLGKREAARFLARGKHGSGEYLTALLGSEEGCRTVLRLIDALSRGEPVPVAFSRPGMLEARDGKLRRVRL